MEGYIGYWEDKITFSPSVTDEELFVSLKLSFRIENRQIYMKDTSSGISATKLGRDKHGGLGLAFGWHTGHRYGKSIYRMARWSRCKFEVTTLDQPHEEFMIEIPENHLLPWPRYMECKRGHMPEVSAREFKLRASSAYDAGGDAELKRVLGRVPPKYKRVIGNGAWAHIVNEIREGTSAL